MLGNQEFKLKRMTEKKLLFFRIKNDTNVNTHFNASIEKEIVVNGFHGNSY
jgi:hypothetical protein